MTAHSSPPEARSAISGAHEPVILPFHDTDLNAARWLRDLELQEPLRGEERATRPLFADANGQPFKDGTFAGFIMGVLEVVLGASRAKLYSPHSWRVWLASALRMCNASDARIQAMGRWLNPASVKIYARMSKEEYGEWVDKLMAVKRIDTARTTNLPIMDAADAFAGWSKELGLEKSQPLEGWGDKRETAVACPPPLDKGARVEVYWTELQEWYSGTYRQCRKEAADDGGMQYASQIVYDAVGNWETCSAKELTYWHCLDDELWKMEGE